MKQSKTSQTTVAFLLFPDLTQLDLAGPAQVLSRLSSVNLQLVGKQADAVPTDSGFPLSPTATFDQVRECDVLCVPGGFGTLRVMQDPDTLEWVRSVADSAAWVTSVCTGSMVLAAAGLLRGYRATCHFGSVDQLLFFDAIPVRERVVVDRNRITGAGVTAGIDFAIRLAAEIEGEASAKLIQLSLEYDPSPPYDCGSPERADSAILAAYQKMVDSVIPNRSDVVRAIASELGFAKTGDQ